ncbi:Brefeldin A-inhibited guanine nucleotide-exchange protein 1, partial [Ascosphaera aggregata]
MTDMDIDDMSRGESSGQATEGRENEHELQHKITIHDENDIMHDVAVSAIAHSPEPSALHNHVDDDGDDGDAATPTTAIAEVVTESIPPLVLPEKKAEVDERETATENPFKLHKLHNGDSTGQRRPSVSQSHHDGSFDDSSRPTTPGTATDMVTSPATFSASEREPADRRVEDDSEDKGTPHEQSWYDLNTAAPQNNKPHPTTMPNTDDHKDAREGGDNDGNVENQEDYLPQSQSPMRTSSEVTKDNESTADAPAPPILTRDDENKSQQPLPQSPITLERQSSRQSSITPSISASTGPTESNHARRASRSSTSHPLTSVVFITTALDAIGNSRDARRNSTLLQAVGNARSNIKNASDATTIDPEVIFKPLHMAAKTNNVAVQVAALDCIGTLITYSYFAFPSVSMAENRERQKEKQQAAETAAAEAEAVQAEQSSQQPPSTVHPTVEDARSDRGTTGSGGSFQEPVPLIERAIETICDCFENESTPPEIQQQIVKSLLAAVLNDKIVVHGAGLLKAVRQIYNIFIYSRDNQNQQIAQGSLTQMVGTVLDRVKARIEMKEARMKERGVNTAEFNDYDSEQGGDSSITIPIGETDATGSQTVGERSSMNTVTTTASTAVPNSERKQQEEKLTLQSFETNQTRDEGISDNAPTMVTRARTQRSKSFVSAYLRPSSSNSAAPSTPITSAEDQQALDDELDELYVKDAFLVIRALCKLSHKMLSHDQQQDLKSQNMRTKLLSLCLLQLLMTQYISVFMSPLAVIRSGVERNGAAASKDGRGEGITLLQAIKPHLCLSLSRNGASAVPRIYEVCCEIFWLMLKHMRVLLKKEVEVFLKEIYLAILNKRNSPIFQKQGFLDILSRLSLDPRAL